MWRPRPFRMQFYESTRTLQRTRGTPFGPSPRTPLSAHNEEQGPKQDVPRLFRPGCFVVSPRNDGYQLAVILAGAKMAVGLLDTRVARIVAIDLCDPASSRCLRTRRGGRESLGQACSKVFAAALTVSPRWHHCSSRCDTVVERIVVVEADKTGSNRRVPPWNALPQSRGHCGRPV